MNIKQFAMLAPLVVLINIIIIVCAVSAVVYVGITVARWMGVPI